MERFNSFSSDQIIVTKRQASMFMATMLLLCLFIFIVGFFLGKRTIIDDFSSQVTKEALHDQIDFLLTTQSLQENSAVIEADFTIEQQDVAIITQDKIAQNYTVTADVKLPRPQEFPVINESSQSEQTKQIIEVKKAQYAQLIGFGTKQAAQAFVNRLKKHQVPVILKTMISKTASGKQRTWYQAITLTYESAQELQDQITKIKRLEHIRGSDIKIVYVK